VSRPVALVVVAPGTNRNRDVADALELAGAQPHTALISDVVDRPRLLEDVHMIVVPGGFSHADSLGAGRVFALTLALRLGDRLRAFVDSGRPVIGICNGFQTLVRAGLLPGALGHNAGGRFQCEWVTLDPQPGRCIWTRGLDPFDCPIAHGEGRYVHSDVVALDAAGQVALRYRVDPNGSAGAVAGVCDETGLVLGLMPHPENHVVARQHPQHRRGAAGGSGVHLFERGVHHAQEVAAC
jgi:phosphoribosylformylglycinamidine synthase